MQGKNQQNCSVSLENGVETVKKSETVAGFASFGHPQTSSASVKVHHTRPCRHPIPRTPASRAASFSFRQNFRRSFRFAGRNRSTRQGIPRSKSHTCPHRRSSTDSPCQVTCHRHSTLQNRSSSHVVSKSNTASSGAKGSALLRASRTPSAACSSSQPSQTPFHRRSSSVMYRSNRRWARADSGCN